ncbi:sigma-70 family RNA polymerase sigma factor [Corynebacterium sp. zg254]|uniref:Sigma-70 family RNA polymerase sigma factor n=1 Tax=Corynebacterium zhongnanshanii TaxID=2768834 RepID=A0ABQ6VBN7_9CORY|nr:MULTISPECIES: sigma-70 family RNA polymerase sigma factor [Corynebacterium]KAB3519166.1 sigma-70 family RNA polymerase sigma factor [Corynebacterium zhongnanshanii]MCR5915013.1 sigma-70 family RNA polymerase sigma factor [Corynebacterium sp. zg254]
MTIALHRAMMAPMNHDAWRRDEERLSIALDDVELLRRHLDGHPWAFTALVRRYHRQLWWAIHSSCVPADHHMDVLQEGLLRIHRFARKFRGLTAESTSTVGTWMVAIMRNACHTFLRAQTRHAPNLPLEDSILRVEHRGGATPRATMHLAADSDNALERAVIRMDVHRALKQMSPELRDVLINTSLRGMSVDEYARREGIPVGTVKSRRSRAKKQLERLLNPQEYSVASAG